MPAFPPQKQWVTVVSWSSFSNPFSLLNVEVSSETPCRRSKSRSGPQSRSTPPPPRRTAAVSNPHYAGGGGGGGTNDSGVAFYHRSSIADKMSDYEDIWYDTLPRDGGWIARIDHRKDLF